MKIHARYPQSESGLLAELAVSLWRQQVASWPTLAAGAASLDSIQCRELRLNGTTVRLQYNPGRLASIRASVDTESIARRKCFLCVEHLPEQQRGIDYRDEFLILCNPAPIFRQHFTFAHRQHLPQSFEPWTATFLRLAYEMNTSYSVFYNGPACGASAPDHMHFQICPSGELPLEGEISKTAKHGMVRTIEGVTVRAVTGLSRGVILLEGTNLYSLEFILIQCLRALTHTTGSDDEPMINVLATVRDQHWHVIIIPRKAHRPSYYYLPEPDRILISPGSVDMAGLVITAAEKDYRNVNAEQLRTIYQQVAFDDQFVVDVVDQMSG